MSDTRTQFEAWVMAERSTWCLDKRPDGAYKFEQTFDAWVVWQAAAKQSWTAIADEKPPVGKEVLLAADDYEGWDIKTGYLSWRGEGAYVGWNGILKPTHWARIPPPPGWKEMT